MIWEKYVTLAPVIFGGVCNMVFTKTGLYRRRATPMDGGRLWRDGRRILGENKTWIGFFAMVLFCALGQWLWGYLCALPPLAGYNALYAALPNRGAVNLGVGGLFGLAYMLFELPNSFCKRRLNIVPGKTGRGPVGAVFFVVDQLDSILGVTLVLALLTPLTPGDFFWYLLLGGLTHPVVNALLYALRIRKNI